MIGVKSNLFLSVLSLSLRLHLQILSRKCVLLPLVPPPAQPRSGGALPERPEEILNPEDRLRGSHENTLHQRSAQTL